MAIELGECRARALKVELAMTGTDKEQAVILFECFPLELESKQVLGTIATFRTLEGNTPETTQKILKRRLEEFALIGFSLETGELVKDPPFVRITIGEEEDQEGELRKRVEWINALERTMSVKNVMGESQKASFLARMRAHATNTGAPVVGGAGADAPVAGAVAEPWDES